MVLYHDSDSSNGKLTRVLGDANDTDEEDEEED